MTTINIYCYIVLIILSITVQIKSEICEKTVQYGECSTNIACGCFHMKGVNDDIGVCGFLWPTCSRLVPCNSSDNSCLESDKICVHHPQCDDRPLCYPVPMADQRICPPKENMINSKWEQNGMTVAGGNGYGSELNQIFLPTGLFIDNEKTIYIADYYNHRIVAWKLNSTNGQIIADGNGNGNDQFKSPTNVIFDKQSNTLILCDRGNRRVIRWFYQDQIKSQVLISDIACFGLAIDKNGFIYVSDFIKGEVRQWKEGEQYGRIVAGGNGNGNQLNQLYYPTYIFIDEDSSLYISDFSNHRVMKWRKDAKEGIVVAGGNDKGSSLKQLSNPEGVFVDHLSLIYVADRGNNRIMRWCEGKEEGEIILGGNGQGAELNQLSEPSGLSFDIEGNLYVVDSNNHRVQKYLIDI
ncbi:unnamed protein product [Adineta steineri]|uniref:NHL repeat containing protein n=1 Tax=Adineta steineri TaxID=433720 RepID=A0A815HDH8_9BILA|nr:unnamed protein product [Adineta steineri]CAF3913894.1 unnamed protein product [Adineta steineri]